MTYHPNWQAKLDGEVAGTVMLSPGYVGVRAPPGDHVLEMSYSPPAWTRLLAWAGLGFLGLVAAADARRRALERRR